MKLNRRELGTVLAALRHWQNFKTPDPARRPTYEDFQMIATDCYEVDPLTVEEIDELCEKLNQ